MGKDITDVSAPCGDVVLKLDYAKSKGKSSGEFPSPCGGVVLKSFLKVKPFEHTANLFPSPCGDVVLKLLQPSQC